MKRGGIRPRLTTDEFVSRSNFIHKNKYTYPEIEYKNNHTKVTIRCPIHGDFEQEPHIHLKGSGCIKCAHNQKTTTEFVELAKTINGDLYDYSKFKYSTESKKSTIICKIHGEFQQSPCQHIKRTQGCPKCGGSFPLTTSEFVDRSKLLNGDKFDYSLVDYKNMHVNVKIICGACGKTFSQKPYSHFHAKSGCPHCSSSSSEKELEFLSSVGNVSHQKYLTGVRGPVDGYDQKTNTVYEFLGDFWHGNPTKYRPEDINPISKLKYGKLYENTIIKFELLTKLGYVVRYIWETDWDLQRKQNISPVMLETYIEKSKKFN